LHGRQRKAKVAQLSKVTLLGSDLATTLGSQGDMMGGLVNKVLGEHQDEIVKKIGELLESWAPSAPQSLSMPGLIVQSQASTESCAPGLSSSSSSRRFSLLSFLLFPSLLFSSLLFSSLLFSSLLFSSLLFSSLLFTTQHNTTQHNTTQHNTKQNTTNHNKTKQNKTKQNKTKQNKTKQL